MPRPQSVPPAPLLPEEGWPKAGVEGAAGGQLCRVLRTLRDGLGNAVPGWRPDGLTLGFIICPLRGRRTERGICPTGAENGTRNLSYGDGERNADALVRRFRHLLNVIRRGWGSRPVRAPHSVRTGASAFLGINHQQTVKDQTIPFKHSQTPHRFEAHSAQNARFARNAQKTGTGAVAVGLRVRSPHVSKGVRKEK